MYGCIVHWCVGKTIFVAIGLLFWTAHSPSQSAVRPYVAFREEIPPDIHACKELWWIVFLFFSLSNFPSIYVSLSLYLPISVSLYLSLLIDLPTYLFLPLSLYLSLVLVQYGYGPFPPSFYKIYENNVIIKIVPMAGFEQFRKMCRTVKLGAIVSSFLSK